MSRLEELWMELKNMSVKGEGRTEALPPKQSEHVLECKVCNK